MKKNIVLAGVLVVAGFVGLTAFGGKTLEQQKAEIAQAVQGKLDMLRSQLDEECTARIKAEAQARYAKFVDEQNAAEAAAAKKPMAKTKPKTSGKGPNIPAPAPQPTKPPVPESQGKWQQGGAPTESKEKWQQSGASGQPAPPQESKTKWQKGGGGQ